MVTGYTISPGFIYYDASENQYYGYGADIKELSQFENKIIPDILSSDSTTRMLAEFYLSLSGSIIDGVIKNTSISINL